MGGMSDVFVFINPSKPLIAWDLNDVNVIKTSD